MKASSKSSKAPRRKAAAKRRSAAARGRSSAIQKTTQAQLARERNEALEQQAATADVLKLISRATFDLQSVLDKVAESAARLCDAEMAGITREQEGAYYYASVHNYPAELHEFIKNVRHERSRGSVTGRSLLESKTIHVPDVTRDPEYTMRDFAQKAGFRTALGVPLLRDGLAIGVIVLTRSQVRPFSEKQIELVRTFAAQAVIAIDNARLLNELRQRTDDLTKSLEQQTATSKVLEVISSSAGDLKPVFEAILENAVRLCGAKIRQSFSARNWRLPRRGDAQCTACLRRTAWGNPPSQSKYDKLPGDTDETAGADRRHNEVTGLCGRRSVADLRGVAWGTPRRAQRADAA
jgi:GAF domain-containing protein